MALAKKYIRSAVSAVKAPIQFEGKVSKVAQEKIKRLLFFQIFTEDLKLVKSIEKLRRAIIDLQNEFDKDAKAKHTKELKRLINKYNLKNVDTLKEVLLKNVFQDQLKELIKDIKGHPGFELNGLQNWEKKLTKKIDSTKVKEKKKNLETELAANRARQQTLREEIEKMKKILLEFVKEYKLTLTNPQKKELQPTNKAVENAMKGTQKKKLQPTNKAVADAMKGTGIDPNAVKPSVKVTPYKGKAKRGKGKKKKKKGFVDDDFLSLKF